MFILSSILYHGSPCDVLKDTLGLCLWMSEISPSGRLKELLKDDYDLSSALRREIAAKTTITDGFRCSVAQMNDQIKLGNGRVDSTIGAYNEIKCGCVQSDAGVYNGPLELDQNGGYILTLKFVPWVHHTNNFPSGVSLFFWYTSPDSWLIRLCVISSCSLSVQDNIESHESTST